jgi:hypothetical protein
MLEVLSRAPQTQIVDATNNMEKLIKERDLFPSSEDCQRLGTDYHYYQDKQINPIDILTISEIIWDLILEHIVTPGINVSNPNLPFFRLTKFGQDYITQSAPHYCDPQGYMEFLRNIVQNLDPVMEQYIFESLNCYRQQLFFASAVMLGAAAEKAILLLLQAITNSMSNPSSKRKAAQLLDKPNLPEISDMITKTLNLLIKAKTIPYSVHQGCTEHLMSFFEMIRVQRNDAIHPACGQVNRTKVFLSLQTMPTALESVNKLVDWFNSNSIP